MTIEREVGLHHHSPASGNTISERAGTSSSWPHKPVPATPRSSPCRYESEADTNTPRTDGETYGCSVKSVRRYWYASAKTAPWLCKVSVSIPQAPLRCPPTLWRPALPASDAHTP